MEHVFGKFNYYDLFGHLLPGVIIGLLLNYIITSTTLEINIKFITDSVVINLFIFYFIGLVLNRVSAVLIEPPLIKLNILHKCPYHQIIKAEKEDYKLVQLQAVIISYRTFIAGFSLVILLLILLFIFGILNINIAEFFILLISLLLLNTVFFISYKKQFNGYTARVMYYAENSQNK